MEAAVQALHDGVHQYAPMAGRPDLRAWICGHHAERHGATYDPTAECTVGAGASSLLFAAITAFVQPGDEVVIQTRPTTCTPRLWTLAGGRLVEVPLLRVDGAWNVDALIGAIHERTRLVVLNTPHNPTGTVCRRASSTRWPTHGRQARCGAFG